MLTRPDIWYMVNMLNPLIHYSINIYYITISYNTLFQIWQPGRGGDPGPSLVWRPRDGGPRLLQGPGGAATPRPGQRPRLGRRQLQVQGGLLQGAHTDIWSGAGCYRWVSVLTEINSVLKEMMWASPSESHTYQFHHNDIISAELRCVSISINVLFI